MMRAPAFIGLLLLAAGVDSVGAPRQGLNGSGGGSLPG